jgi:predicted dehydrogenase
MQSLESTSQLITPATRIRRLPGIAAEPDAAVRFGLVGCGRIAQSHIEALAGSELGSVAAVIDPREVAAKAASEQARSLCFGDYADPDLIDAVDAVIVCTPPVTHYEIARHFLTHGKHVLCEKPLTIQSEQATELVSLAKRAGCVLMMASKFRYVDDVIKSKAIVQSGILGDILLYENAFCSKVDMRDRWNSNREIAGGGVLIDNGSHAVDIARYLLGPITHVQAEVARGAQDLAVEDSILLRFRSRSGTVGSIDLSWSINKESPHYLGIYGTQGTLLVGWKGSRYRQDGNANWVSFGAGYDKVAAFRAQIENFIATTRGAEQPLMTPADAVASVRVVEAAYASVENQSWVAL